MQLEALAPGEAGPSPASAAPEGMARSPPPVAAGTEAKLPTSSQGDPEEQLQPEAEQQAAAGSAEPRPGSAAEGQQPSPPSPAGKVAQQMEAEGEAAAGEERSCTSQLPLPAHAGPKDAHFYAKLLIVGLQQC